MKGRKRMKKGMVFLIEDDKALIGVEKRFIQGEGHDIVLVAHSRQEALDKISQAKELGVNVAVVDGNLGTGPNDGPQVARALKEAIAGIKIISFSGDIVDWGDFNPRKPREIVSLGETVTKSIRCV